MYFTRAQWRDIVFQRVDTVRESIEADHSHESIIRLLREQQLVSKYYDMICLAVDVWFMFDRELTYTNRRLDEITAIRDPVTRMFFAITVQALYDIRQHRPCDSHSWRLDHPPDGKRCSPTLHICEREALRFIKETATLYEHILNLQDGTLMHLAKRKNGSRKSRSQEIINCIGRES